MTLLGAILSATCRAAARRPDGGEAPCARVLSLSSFALVAADALVASGAADAATAADGGALRAALSLCARPLPSMPADATGRWLSRSQLVEQASRLAHALAPAPAPLFVTLRDARMLSVRRSNAAVRRAAAERAAAAAAAPAAEAGAEKAKVVKQMWDAKWGMAGVGTVYDVKLSKMSSDGHVDDASAAVSATPLPSSGSCTSS